jgi:aminopeptidase N
VEPEYAPYATKMFNHTPEMLTYFSEVTGVPYPWNKYSQVVVRDYVSGAMENTSASLFGEFLNQNTREIADYNSEDVVSHELFHQWFGDYVTAESWSNLTLNESFADYGENLWRQHQYGSVSANEMLFYGLQGYLWQSKQKDPSLVRYFYNDKEEVFDGISYQKGGLILHCMHSLMGDAAFSKAMHLYLTKNALQPAEATQWRLAVEEATGQDWNWYFNQWYYKGGHPVLNVHYDYDDNAQLLTVKVSQKQADSVGKYILPLKATVIYGDAKHSVDWRIGHRETTYTYPYKNGERPVIIPDATHILVGELKDNKKLHEWLQQFKYSEDYISKRLALEAALKKTEDTTAQAIIDLGLNDKIPEIRTVTLQMLNAVKEEKLHKKWQKQVASMVASEGRIRVRVAALSLSGQWKIKSCKADMYAALTDTSYSVVGAALYAISQVDKDTAYTIAKDLLATKPKGNLYYTVWGMIGNKGIGEDIDLYDREKYKVSGYRKYTFIGSLAAYMDSTKNDESFEKGVDILGELTNYESSKMSYYSYIIQVVKYYATQQKAAKHRLSLIKKCAEQIIHAETDKDTAKQYQTLLDKALNGEEEKGRGHH